MFINSTFIKFAVHTAIYIAVFDTARNFNKTICQDVARSGRVKNKMLNEMWNKLREGNQVDGRFLSAKRRERDRDGQIPALVPSAGLKLME